ncbi:hypothetical protein F4859DRAFT_529997 [Xylaria cf. heliscus]|nr:hypothetical protein F4859DRAFT_529997 [Xylaria cf. heliscus]
MSSQLNYPSEPIAVVGSACRFAGEVSSPSKLWDLLRTPRDVLSKIPPSRFNAAKFHHPDNLHHGTSNVQHAYLLSEDHRLFDAQFFGVKPVEASAIDPQQRLLLETTYEALESAGIPLGKIQGTDAGVFVGLMNEDYSTIVGRDLDNVPTYFASGTARSIMANRLSYFFDVHGPSMVIDTACSSSLVALHQAVLSLRGRESKVAIVAGANLLLGPEYFIAEAKLKMLSPTGRSRMWDKDADGYARADGFGVLILKTLADAIADGDSIECVVRETGINQDGRTKGITMPNPKAQADLIRVTYAKAGLDLAKASDRPQYFEAHGTGTPAGDPMEAEAISSTFFGSSSGFTRSPGDHPMYVGSIKTVLGHTEGTAGIAGLLRASLAMQNGLIPPNMLLNELNPQVKPFYTNLKIAKTAVAWPGPSETGPRRASVNSFGFGGANAHAILESYMPPSTQASNDKEEPIPLVPFNFSAATEKSLIGNLRALAEYARVNPLISVRDLAWTLNTRRTTLPTRVSISSSTITDLVARLESVSATSDGIVTSTNSSRSNSETPRLLGVFTGQGAQWATMGARLIRSSHVVTECLDKLQQALESLPRSHRPSWSLKEELLKGPETSLIGQAAFSQPLCTAIQIVLVQLLKAANIKFASVVGHSSGEIGAAYAAGYISAEDAIKIAYYRGYFLKLANATEGGMMAAEMNHEDAQELCELPSLNGRVQIAAKNSPTSVTLSGDMDAILEARDILEDENKFARILKVDKAYHSHHMLPCGGPYVEALRRCGIKVLPRSHRSGYPTWISSVTGEDIESSDLTILGGQYWADNQANTVLFTQALECAIGASGPFDMGVEVGPHPALKKPALETISNVMGSDIPYTGLLSRGKNDIEAFASGLGSLWLSLGEGVVDFDAFDKATHAANMRPPKLVKGLPTYSWVHDRVYWHETRYGKAWRLNGESSHQLLGTVCPEEADGEIRFRNFLSPRDIPWLVDHRVQDQIVFPAAGYISSVIEALARLHPIKDMKLIQFSDLIIGQALFVPEEGGIESLLSIKETQVDSSYRDYVFSYYSDSNRDSNGMIVNASGRVRLLFGVPAGDALPPPYLPTDQLVEFEPERFYTAARDFGFGYEGAFQGMVRTTRRIGEGAGLLAVPNRSSRPEEDIILHPGLLDSAVQSILVSFCYPGDGRMRDTHLPTRVDRISINVSAWLEATRVPNQRLPFYSTITSEGPGDFTGDVEVSSSDGKTMLIQLQGLYEKVLTPQSTETDLKIFSETTWGPELPVATTINWEDEAFNIERTLSFSLERVAYFYLRKLSRDFPVIERDDLRPHFVKLLEYADYVASSVNADNNPWIRKEWDEDTEEDISTIANDHKCVDMRLIKAVGENLPFALSRNMDMLAVMTRNDMLSSFYEEALGMTAYTKKLADVVRQLSHRFPHMNILELGASKGGATQHVLNELDNTFSSYTYSDSTEFSFQESAERFQQYKSRLLFKALDINRPAAEQNFNEASYDLIIASLALHGTRNLEKTMTHVRKLLRPGGYLIMLEFTDNDPLRFGLLFGGLPGWWAGYDDGRKLSPCVSSEAWEEVAIKAGFSGIDTITPHSTTCPIPLSTIVFQATNTQVEFLRQPLTLNTAPLGLKGLTVIGGQGVSKKLRQLLQRHYKSVQWLDSMEELSTTSLPFLGTVVSFADVNEESVLRNLTERSLDGIRSMFTQSKATVWVTYGARADNPLKNMFLGFQRTVALELSIRAHFLDFASLEEVNVDLVIGKLLTLEAYTTWKEQGQGSDLLWYSEPDLLVQGGKVLVPRLRSSKQRNDRYNSTKRTITRQVTTTDTMLSIVSRGGKLQVEEPPLALNINVPKVRLRHSMLRALQVGKKSTAFISYGEMSDTADPVIVLSNNLSSHVDVPSLWTIPVPTLLDQPGQILVSMYTQILAQSILARTVKGTALVVFNADRLLGNTLSELAAEKGINLRLLTTRLKRLHQPWAYVHEQTASRIIPMVLPTNVSVFVNFDEQSDVSHAIQRCLPPMCLSLIPTDLLSDSSHLDLSPAGIRAVSDCLQAAWLRCMSKEMVEMDSASLPTLDLNAISSTSSFVPPTQAILSWNIGRAVDLHVRPASELVRFKQDKTYWLVGLTGGLGLSLSEWMANRGAKFIALSSRNPKIESTWLQMMADRGCTVKVFANDITDKKSVQRAYGEIIDDMPPIGGVAQGAMVLHDTLLPDLSLDRVEKVLRPKVDGTFHLDELFPEDTLDFFLCFSSVAYTNGNAGQSCYGAANAFLAAFAANRRKRGLAGSVINIGVIVGNGYVSREMTPAKQLALWKAGLSFMSEQDFHETFAEGVISSHSGSSDNLEVTTGLRLDDDNGEDSKNWSNNPIFQHLIMRSANPTSSDGKTKAVAIKTQLQEASNDDEVYEIIKEGFLAKLQSSLQTDLDKPLIAIGPDELGIDSLLAVDFQSWFRKELGVDVPVLKILNAPSIHDLLCSAQKLLEPDTIPKIASLNNPTAQIAREVNNTSITLEEKLNKIAPVVHVSPKSPSVTSTSASPTPDESSASSLYSKSADQGTIPTIIEKLSPKQLEAEKTMFDTGKKFERSVPMSFGQSRLWFLKYFLESQSALNVMSLITVKGYLDVTRLERAVISVGKRHEAIRTAFYIDDVTKQPMQGVLAEPGLRLEYVKASSEKEVQAHVENMMKHNYNITEGETVRLKLLSLSDDTHFMIFSYHHISLDGIGLKLFFDDIESAYNGAMSTADDSIIQYPDFSVRQSKQYTDGSWSNHLSYWRANFAEIPPLLPLFALSHKVMRPERLGYESVSAKARINNNLKGKIKSICRQLRISPYHFYLAVFRILIFRYTGNTANSLCIGVADGNRKDADTLRSLGLYLNLVPLRFTQNMNQTFASTAKDSKAISDESFSHSRVPFDILLTELQITRDLSHNPLFQAFFNYRQNIQEARQWCGCETSGDLVQSGQNGYDFSLDITDSAVQENQFVMSVNTDLYTKSGAETLMSSYLHLLEKFVSNPSTQISTPSLYPEVDISAAIELGRGPEFRSKWPATMVDRIDYIIHTYPDRYALKDTLQHSMTYKQMSTRIHQLSAQLIDRSVIPGDVVGIYQQAGVDWMCSLLAILRSGAVVVPLDFQVGPGRLRLIVEDCRPKYVMVDSETCTDVDFITKSGAKLVNISDISTRGQVPHIPSRAKASMTAIMAYTSGSTGVPKGIVLGHRGYRNLMEFSPPTWGIREGNEVVLQQSSYAFDVSMMQTFTSLGWGGTLIIPDASKRSDPVAISDLIISEGITFAMSTPTEYQAWAQVADLEALSQSSWRFAMSGGEPMTKSLLRTFQSINKPDLKLLNCYGPAEATVAVACSVVPYLDVDNADFTIATLPNYTIRIVDNDLKPVPAGVSGQVVLGGMGIALGYLNREKLNSTAFIPDSEASVFLQEEKGTTVHLTGDRGRLDARGRLTLLGRIEGSTQIKIGAIRMDLEDVENTITETMALHVSHAAVSPLMDASGNIDSLVAFVALSTSNPPADQAAFLAELPRALPLPNYMRPSLVIALESIPMTSSAKINRPALARMVLEMAKVTHPVKQSDSLDLNSVERELEQLWQEVIPARSIQAHTISQGTDFFQVGGSSLSLMNLQRLMKDRFGTTVPIVQLFQASSLGKMAALLKDPQGAAQVTTQDKPTDWEEEITIPSEITELARESIPARRTSPKASGIVIVLTGATGFLGKEIVQQLVASDQVSKVHCLAVRQASQHLVTPSPKIVVHNGDLAAPRLGLSVSDAQAVFNEADAIIHAGADVSFLKTYSSLRAANVGSTRELVRLALPRRVPFHFVSSGTVVRLTGREGLGPVSVAAWPPPKDGEPGSDLVDGYTAAKWVNEVYLERVANKLALDVVVHRPTSIVPNGDGEEAARPRDLLGNLMLYMRRTHSVPDTGNMRGVMDFVRVGTVAARLIERVVASVRSEVAVGERGGIEYMYEASETVVEVQDVKAFLEAELGNGKKFKVLPRMEWVDAAERAGMDPLLSAYIRQSIDGPIVFPRVLEA